VKTIILWAATAVTALGICGCGAEWRSRPVVRREPPARITYVRTAPVEVERYPRVYYEGGYAYYGDGRWYRPSPRGWGYYETEPEGLAHQRPFVERHEHEHERGHEHER
jgi:hypothetical protein